MFRAWARATHNARLVSRIITNNQQRARQAVSLSLIGAVSIWAIPTTLLDDGISAGGKQQSINEIAAKRDAPAADTELQRAWAKAYKNAKDDPESARAATFREAEITVERLANGQYGLVFVGPIPVDEHMSHIFKMAHTAIEDTRLWVLTSNAQDPPRVRAVYFAANVAPENMENHMLMITALQFELDRMREQGRLQEGVTIPSMIQFRNVKVWLDYGSDGCLTPVMFHPLTRKRLHAEPLRASIMVDEKGNRFLIPATPTQPISGVAK